MEEYTLEQYKAAYERLWRQYLVVAAELSLRNAVEAHRLHAQDEKNGSFEPSHERAVELVEQVKARYADVHTYNLRSAITRAAGV